MKKYFIILLVIFVLSLWGCSDEVEEQKEFFRLDLYNNCEVSTSMFLNRDGSYHMQQYETLSVGYDLLGNGIRYSYYESYGVEEITEKVESYIFIYDSMVFMALLDNEEWLVEEMGYTNLPDSLNVAPELNENDFELDIDGYYIAKTAKVGSYVENIIGDIDYVLGGADYREPYFKFVIERNRVTKIMYGLKYTDYTGDYDLKIEKTYSNFGDIFIEIPDKIFAKVLVLI